MHLTELWDLRVVNLIYHMESLYVVTYGIYDSVTMIFVMSVRERW